MKNNHITTLISSLAADINRYIDTRSQTDFDHIADKIKNHFTSQHVQLWRYDAKNDVYSLFGTKDTTTVSIHKGLTYQALLDRNPLISNHLSSNKDFVQEIDNPLALKVRALMIHPVVDDQGNIQGYLKLWKGLQQQRVFTEHDKVLIKSLTPLLLNLLHYKHIETDTLESRHTHKDLKKRESETRLHTHQTPTPDAHTASKIKTLEDENLYLSKQVQSLQEKLDEMETLRKKETQYLAHLESVLQERPTPEAYTKLEREKAELISALSSLKEKEEKSQRQLNALQFEHGTLQQSAEEITTEILQYQETLKEHKRHIHTLKQENDTLRHKLDKAQKTKKEDQKHHTTSDVSVSPSVAQQKNMQTNVSTLSDIESILPEYSAVFGKHQYAYILYEMITYTLNAPKQMHMIDSLIEKAKIVPKLLASYTFTQAVKPKEEKVSITGVLTQLEKQWRILYENRPRLIMQVSQQIPPTLIIDEVKLYNILLHILAEIQHFIKEDQPIVLHAKYQNKILYFDIKGTAPKKSHLLTLFKQNLPQTKQEPGFTLSRNLIYMLKGSLSVYQEDTQYGISLKFPVNIIKL